MIKSRTVTIPKGKYFHGELSRKLIRQNLLALIQGKYRQNFYISPCIIPEAEEKTKLLNVFG